MSCPQCGYCPYCGRSGSGQNYPSYLPPYSYPYSNPNITYTSQSELNKKYQEMLYQGVQTTGQINNKENK